jgi:prenylcysteine oxidase/farnesylcysteine lyase
LRAIFCQDDSINAFAGAVGLIAVGAVGGKSLAVTGGNNLLCERLLDAAGAELLLGQEVLSVTRAEDQSASLISTATGSVPFDAVILATPVNNGPQTSGFTGTSRSRLDFEIVHVTYVSGILLADFFGFPSANMIPDYIMTTESGNSPFCSIGLVGRSPQFGSSTYRIASREVLSQDLLKQMFGRVDDILRTSWNAFPFLSPGNKSTPFKLDIGLYFTGSMESTVSTLETQVVGSRNVVALMKSDYDFAE